MAPTLADRSIRELLSRWLDEMGITTISPSRLRWLVRKSREHPVVFETLY
ncbi:TPA: hypothetical protein N0F65_005817 [Lagenidium giganteum]|uniref:Uncharacterized protein n=1 Tax=Lagenidium giganteum TaxID=4803 RepID=A0AAV2YTK6_9STRA|nr:TPA: hypothetical protein N0F65_005817 [Lagenidium giganteum]